MNSLIIAFISVAWFDGAYNRKQAFNAAIDNKVCFDDVEAYFNELAGEL